MAIIRLIEHLYIQMDLSNFVRKKFIEKYQQIKNTMKTQIFHKIKYDLKGY